ncbi:MAG: DUF4327 family protein [Snowella sp.]|nr:DUF4327 family protein [Snowella sp.]
MLMLIIPRYSIHDLKEEAKELVYQGKLSRQHHLYSLCEFLPCNQWKCVEIELEKHGFLLRDYVIDLLSSEEWEVD